MSKVLRVFYTSFENKRKKKVFCSMPFVCFFLMFWGLTAGPCPSPFLAQGTAPGLRAPFPPPSSATARPALLRAPYGGGRGLRLGAGLPDRHARLMNGAAVRGGACRLLQSDASPRAGWAGPRGSGSAPVPAPAPRPPRRDVTVT